MKQYDATCPICGTVNRGLYLDETDGWLECEHCGASTIDMKYYNAHSKKVPVYRMTDLPKLLAKNTLEMETLGSAQC